MQGGYNGLEFIAADQLQIKISNLINWLVASNLLD